jgi:hypothetical protein
MGFWFQKVIRTIRGWILIFFKGLQLLYRNTTPTLTQNMKSKNVDNFPTSLQQQQKCIFVPFIFIIFTIIVRKEKKKNEVEFFSIEN